MSQSKNTNLAKALRQNLTDAEKLLWKHLRGKQLEDCKFRRQVPIDDYIVDFISFDKRIVIEVDGGQHAEKLDDVARDKHLNDEGFKVLRFWNNEVLDSIEGVLESIREAL